MLRTFTWVLVSAFCFGEYAHADLPQTVKDEGVTLELRGTNGKLDIPVVFVAQNDVKIQTAAGGFDHGVHAVEGLRHRDYAFVGVVRGRNRDTCWLVAIDLRDPLKSSRCARTAVIRPDHNYAILQFRAEGDLVFAQLEKGGTISEVVFDCSRGEWLNAGSRLRSNLGDH